MQNILLQFTCVYIFQFWATMIDIMFGSVWMTCQMNNVFVHITPSLDYISSAVHLALKIPYQFIKWFVLFFLS